MLPTLRTGLLGCLICPTVERSLHNSIVYLTSQALKPRQHWLAQDKAVTNLAELRRFPLTSLSHCTFAVCPKHAPFIEFSGAEQLRDFVEMT